MWKPRKGGWSTSSLIIRDLLRYYNELMRYCYERDVFSTIFLSNYREQGGDTEVDAELELDMHLVATRRKTLMRKRKGFNQKLMTLQKETTRVSDLLALVGQ